MSKFRIEFEISGLPKLINGGWGKSHWAVQAKYRREWRSLVSLIVATKRPDKPLNKAKLTLIRFSNTAPDPDNLAASFKHVIDGLVDAGVLVNDKYENIGMPNYLWEKTSPGKGKIKVIVEAAHD